MSYVHFDDQHERGRVTELCHSLSGEVRLQTGSEFRIFQDRKDIAWGQQWQERIDESRYQFMKRALGRIAPEQPVASATWHFVQGDKPPRGS